MTKDIAIHVIKSTLRPAALIRLLASHGARVLIGGLLLSLAVGSAVFFFLGWRITTNQYDVDTSLRTINERRLNQALEQIPARVRSLTEPPASPF